MLLAFAKALEIIPRQICDNAGIDSTDLLNKLRARHHQGDRNYGVDVDGPEGVRDNMKAFVWEPSLVKLNAISSAAEAACLILSVDETVRNPQSEAVRPIPCGFDGLNLMTIPCIIDEHRTEGASRSGAAHVETWTWTRYASKVKNSDTWM